MANATADTAWIIDGINIAGDDKTVTLPTAGTYVDRNIQVKITAPTTVTPNKTSIGYGESATIGAGYTAGATITNSVGAGTVHATPTTATTITASVGDTANADGSYPITGNKTVTPGIVVDTAGYVSSTVGTKTSGKAVSASGSVAGSTLSATQITPGAEQTVTIGAGYYPTDRTVTVKAASTGTAGAAAVETGQSISVSGSGTPTKNASGKYEVSVSGSNTITGKVTTSGYVTKDNAITSANVSASGKATINAASIGTSTTNPGSAYTENTTAIVPSGGYLKIDAGYIPATKISLATLVPDGTSDKPAANGCMLAGYKAYDKDGTLLTGTIPERATSDLSASASGKTVTATVPAGYYPPSYGNSPFCTVSASVADGTVKLGTTEKTGDFTVSSSSSDQTITISDGWESARTITIEGASSGTSAAATVSGSKQATAPTIAQGAASTTNTKRVSATPSTTVPASGYYVAVQATAPATSLADSDFTETISTAGYLSEGTQIASSASVTSKTGSVYYAPIGEATHTNTATASAVAATAYVSGSTSQAGTAANSGATYSITGITTSAPSSGRYAKITSTQTTTAGTAKANASCKNTAGYCPGDTTAAAENTASVPVNVPSGKSSSTNYYVSIYEGSYTVA